MIDTDVISGLLKDPNLTNAPAQTEGEVRKLMRNLAFDQLDAIAARETYNSFGFLNPSLQSNDLKFDSIDSMAEALFERMSHARSSIPDDKKDDWVRKFGVQAYDRKQELLLTWEAKWPELCDGKRLISDLHKASQMKISETAFKARIVERMRDVKSDTWRLVESILNEFLKPAIASR